jgi:glycosyltransferase involved in cell wall biosynthesis
MQTQDRFRSLNCCVIIPTYNNGGTLKRVIEEVLEYTQDLIVVNDGATDNTTEILHHFGNKIQIFQHEINQGKGKALRNGFQLALEKGYDYAITIDSDGQHFASDLPLFLDELEHKKNTLIIGARNLNQENVPGKSNFGNKFSNFWFQVETGIKLKDTQSGYRLYPLCKMKDMKFITNLFEFEIEVIVKAAWKNIAVENIPIQVHYEPGEKRISHFRPFRDFSRISVLNTYLVTLALLYYIPLRFIKALTISNIKSFIKDNFFNQTEPAHIKALSLGFGMFMGIFPIWGYQLMVGIPLAHLFRLNKALFVLAAHISIPPMIPVIIYVSFMLGKLITGNTSSDFLFSQGITFEVVKDNLFQYVTGAILLATVMGLLTGGLSYLYFLLVKRKTSEAKAVVSNHVSG